MKRSCLTQFSLVFKVKCKQNHLNLVVKSDSVKCGNYTECYFQINSMSVSVSLHVAYLLPSFKTILNKAKFETFSTYFHFLS